MNHLLVNAHVQNKLEFRFLIKKIYSVIVCWHRNKVTRRQLKQMPNYLLDDIGVTQQQAKRESDKAFWH